MRIKTSWFCFVVFSSLFLLLLNFNFFRLIYTNLDISQNMLMACAIPLSAFFLLTAILALLFVPYCTKTIMICFILIACISAYFIYAYGIIIDVEMIRNVVKTDIKEATELLNFKLISFVLLFGIFPCCLILVCKIDYGTFKKHLFIKCLTFFITIILFLALFLPFTKTLLPFFRSYKQIQVSLVPFAQISFLQKYLSEMLTPKQDFKILHKQVTLAKEEKKIMFLIIGETARAANYSLGGYATNITNPYTMQENIIYFPNFYSCATSTAVSIPCMASLSKRKDYSSKEFQENIFDILAKVGIHTIWYDNNSGGCQGVCNRLQQIHNFHAEYDEVLLTNLKKGLENLHDSNLFVLHLQGSHGPTYYRRYPESFKQFTPTCDTNELQKCEQQEIANTYDNTLLYTDYIISEVIALAKQQSGYETAVFYLSDHGESLGENGIYLHGMPYFLAPIEQTHIPAILWINNDSLHNIIAQHKDFILSHDNLFSSLLGFFHITGNLYEQEYDIFSPNLKENQ